MAHPEQTNFLKSVRDNFPEKFMSVRVLDIGSLDINGNNRHLFSDYEYVGVDIGEGRNVDVVCRGHEYDCDELFDVVVSSECFEHDKYWDRTILNGIRLLKPGGVFLFTCAFTGRPEHGTRRTTPQDSPFTSATEEDDYYMNLTEEDIRSKLVIEDYFEQHQFIEREQWPQDLYFWGIKKDLGD